MPLTTLIESFAQSAKNLSPEHVAIIKTELDNLPPEYIGRLEALFQADNLDQAYISIGEAAGQGAWGIDALKEGKRLFNNFRSQLEKSVCSYKPLRVYYENENAVDLLTVAALVLGGLIAAHTGNIDVISASFILSRMGIRNFCKAHWTTQLND